MLKVVRRSAVHGLCAAVALALWPVTATAQAEPDSSGAQAFPTLPLPPAIEGLIGMPQTYTAARSRYLALITSEAEQRGLPAALADAVAQVESRYSPNAVGSLGEVGLMQIRPRTAALLGYKGEAAGLAEPETNVRLGVAYLARAWQLANGDVCRALMKYRAGWGEERMTPLSVEYCRRARGHLAAIGSPLAGGAVPSPDAPGVNAPTFSADAKTFFRGQPTPKSLAAALTRIPPVPPSRPATVVASVTPRLSAASASPAPIPPSRPATVASVTPGVRPTAIRLAAVAEVRISEARAQAAIKQRELVKVKRKMWAEADARMNAIAGKVRSSQLKIMN